MAVPFLSLWLCGWAAGEVFVGTFLWRAVSGAVSVRGSAGTGTGPALLTFGFLLVWLTFWTFGGVAAITALLKLLTGREEVVRAADAILVHARIGPVTITRRVPRGEGWSFGRARRDGAVVARRETKTLRVAELGTPGDRAALLGALAAEPGFTTAATVAAEVPAELPSGWARVIADDGQAVLAHDPAQARALSRVLVGLAVALGAAAAWSKLTPSGIVFLAGCALAAFGAYAARTMRSEWVLGSRELTLRKRSRRGTVTVLGGTRIRLTSHRDSDNDEWFELELVGNGERKTIARALHEPDDPLRIGRWLERECGVVLENEARP